MNQLCVIFVLFLASVALAAPTSRGSFIHHPRPHHPHHPQVVVIPHNQVVVPHKPPYSHGTIIVKPHPEIVHPKPVVVTPPRPPPAPPVPPTTAAPPVLPPPLPPLPPLPPSPPLPPKVHPTLIKILSVPEFSILVTLLRETGLLEILLAAEHITIFAPTNKAFIATASELCKPVFTPKGAIACFSSLLTAKQIKAVLLYHVLPVTLFSKQILKLTIFETLSGKIIKRRGVKLVDIAKPITNPKLDVLDVKYTKGVVHVITRVLLPFKVVIKVVEGPISKPPVVFVPPFVPEEPVFPPGMLPDSGVGSVTPPAPAAPAPAAPVPAAPVPAAPAPAAPAVPNLPDVPGLDALLENPAIADIAQQLASGEADIASLLSDPAVIGLLSDPNVASVLSDPALQALLPTRR